MYKNLCSWDQNISGEIESNWSDFLADLKQIEMLRVQRFVFVQPKDMILSISLHGFCDSSSQVYCGLVYIRVETTLSIRVRFSCANTKVAPLNKLSFRWFGVIRLCFIDSAYCWSDSEVVLGWARGKEKCWKQWVENRVVNIRNIRRGSKGWTRGTGPPQNLTSKVLMTTQFKLLFYFL